MHACDPPRHTHTHMGQMGGKKTSTNTHNPPTHTQKHFRLITHPASASSPASKGASPLRIIAPIPPPATPPLPPFPPPAPLCFVGGSSCILIFMCVCVYELIPYTYIRIRTRAAPARARRPAAGGGGAQGPSQRSSRILWPNRPRGGTSAACGCREGCRC